MLKTIILLAAMAGLAPAAPITFTFEGVLHSGTYDGLGFSNEPFLLTIQADTDDVTDTVDGRVVPNGPVTLDFQGAVRNVLTPSQTFVNNVFGLVGFFNQTTNSEMLVGPTNSAFDLWDLTTSIGPIAGAGFHWAAGSPLAIQGGPLTIQDAEVHLTFTALTGSAADVPEPASMALLGAGLIVVWILRRSVHARN